MCALVFAVLCQALAKEVVVANRVAARLEGEDWQVLAAGAVEVEGTRVVAGHVGREHYGRASQHTALSNESTSNPESRVQNQLECDRRGAGKALVRHGVELAWILLLW